jgi:hypothetical protein
MKYRVICISAKTAIFESQGRVALPNASFHIHLVLGGDLSRLRPNKHMRS